ncbi:hypothetical protein OV079_11745 [Nannocystis pusilla]|uniref:Uncharacterized protein n=1 Tax=Nannocystis pusilla TaxID=889268 RepID=A0A9X3IW97_9BACT|nr:hypothetical protein [Nannocystis pusilla]MCY1006221.1 hypothetical protein [Nannocystis pusilla]
MLRVTGRVVAVEDLARVLAAVAVPALDHLGDLLGHAARRAADGVAAAQAHHRVGGVQAEHHVLGDVAGLERQRDDVAADPLQALAQLGVALAADPLVALDEGREARLGPLACRQRAVHRLAAEHRLAPDLELEAVRVAGVVGDVEDVIEAGVAARRDVVGARQREQLLVGQVAQVLDAEQTVGRDGFDLTGPGQAVVALVAVVAHHQQVALGHGPLPTLRAPARGSRFVL